MRKELKELKVLALLLWLEEKKIYKKNLKVLKMLGIPNYVGKPSSGQAAKLANQIIVGITIGAVSEAIILSKKLGLKPMF